MGFVLEKSEENPENHAFYQNKRPFPSCLASRFRRYIHLLLILIASKDVFKGL